ncbi:glycosyltransferase family 39 protein [Candidatus Gottesmanbacteria bacterium]|nr:glycosyltransferase family 39 protein [Candidatus Gottesmanbacteria bacterium]
MKKFGNLVLILMVLVSFGVRLYKIDNPVADWHSWRQADTAAVARNFVKFGFTPLFPRYDDLSNVQSGRDNPQGLRLVEFPLYQIMGYAVYKIYPKFSLEIALRLVSIFFSLLAMVFLYALVKKYNGELNALLSAGAFGFLPYSIYYSRAILPEMTGVGLALGAIYALDKANEGGNVLSSKYYILSIISALLAASALLVKPTAGFILLPLAYLFLSDKKLKVLFDPSLYLYGLIAILPFVLWRFWIRQFPEGIPAYEWLLNGGNIRFTGAFFRWIIAERLGKLMLGYTGMFLLFLGLVTNTARKSFVFGSLLLGTILYVVVFARGNVQHDYYQILLIPIIAIYTGRGAASLLSGKLKVNRIARFTVVVLTFLSMLAFSWYEIRGYFWINHPEIVTAGKRVDALVPKDAKVIAPYLGDTAFLYQTNRQGWPVVEKPIPEIIKMGASYLVIVNPDKDALNLAKTYKVLEQKDNYIIFALTK